MMIDFYLRMSFPETLKEDRERRRKAFNKSDLSISAFLLLSFKTGRRRGGKRKKKGRDEKAPYQSFCFDTSVAVEATARVP